MRYPIIITAMTVPNPLTTATLAILAAGHPRFVIWLDPSLKKPRVRAPSERISMAEYATYFGYQQAKEMGLL